MVSVCKSGSTVGLVKRFRRLILCTLVAALSLPPAFTAQAEPIKRRIMTKVFPRVRSVFQYIDEVKRTNGRRIISVPVNPSIVPSTRSIWFQTPNIDRGFFIKTLQWVPMRLTEKWPGGPYEFTPVRTIESLTWGNFTEKFFGVREQLAGPAKFLSATALSILIASGVTAWLDHVTAEKLLSDIEKHHDFYDFFLANDFRCKDIRAAYERGKISRIDAHVQVYQVQAIYSRWFANREFNINRSLDYFKKTLLEFPLFHPLESVVLNGLGPTEGYYINKENLGPLNEGQVRQLFRQADHLAIKHEYITRMTNAPFNLETDIDPRLFSPDLISEVADDPFNKELIEMHRQGQISLGDLVYGLQEHEGWKTEFEHYTTLRVERLSASDGPLTLEQIQKEIKNDVLNRAKHPLH